MTAIGGLFAFADKLDRLSNRIDEAVASVQDSVSISKIAMSVEVLGN